ncbi:acyl-CoA dehydrogenase family protein [Streptomyces sp. NPDC059134]|uniref:acyl-CoA dehydrogenase family protein n=1 Tax=Streptomyces sp. NPDC059134 TaxID=3346738 RepID=UPI0036C433D8
MPRPAPRRAPLPGERACQTEPAVSTVAALKVTVARLGERVTSECAHIFGGRGYVEDQNPMERLWRDLKVNRLGGGSDEMMWELVAAGFRPDHRLYDRWVTG